MFFENELFENFFTLPKYSLLIFEKLRRLISIKKRAVVCQLPTLKYTPINLNMPIGQLG